MLKGETGAFIVAVGRRENRRGCEIIEKILNLVMSIVKSSLSPKSCEVNFNS